MADRIVPAAPRAGGSRREEGGLISGALTSLLEND
jgi:hypothetical protein